MALRILAWIAFSALQTLVSAQAPPPTAPPAPARGDASRFDHLELAIDDLLWEMKLSEIALVDRVSYTSLPPARESNPTAQGAGNPLIIEALTFVPKSLDRSKKHPLIVFAHGGVHSRFGTSYLHIVRELIERGYSVVAPDYRGSTGYGGTFYNQIDYGGREVDDVFEARNWMLSAYPFLDPKRVGMIGWSHGGLITLMNIFQHPEAFAVAYAGVPVSDLVARMGYKGDSYRAIFSDKGHIGKSAYQDVKEYLRRSPISHVASSLRRC